MDKVKIVCRGLITDEKNRVLFVKKEGSNFWSLPGGKLDQTDKDLQSCLERELKEELGIEIGIGDIKFVQELHKNNTRYVELIWPVFLKIPIIIDKDKVYEISNKEIVDIVWVDKSNLDSIEIKPDFLINFIKKT
jgi:8-oxo-dGTP pyrophosphatase MutT (NUDIX family)